MRLRLKALDVIGLPSTIRTCDLRLRRPLLYPAELWAEAGLDMKKRVVDDNPLCMTGRSTRIRTLDPLLPKQVRYRAAPHSESHNYSRYPFNMARRIASSIMRQQIQPVAQPKSEPAQRRAPRPSPAAVARCRTGGSVPGPRCPA